MTMPGDLLSGSLIEVARDLREKRVTARQLIEAAIARHERFGARLHGYPLWAPEQARAVAAAADAAFSAGMTVGPLQGLASFDQGPIRRLWVSLFRRVEPPAA